MSGKVTVKTEEYADWLKNEASQCMNFMRIIERGFDEKFSEMGRIERFMNRKLINHLDSSYATFDRLLTSFCREYTMAQFVIDEGYMMMEILKDNHFNQNRSTALEIYEHLYGKIDTEKNQENE